MRAMPARLYDWLACEVEHTPRRLAETRRRSTCCLHAYSPSSLVSLGGMAEPRAPPRRGCVQVAALASAALGLLRRNLHEPFDLTLINLGATSFSESGAAGSRNIAAMIAAGRAGSETSSHAGAGAGAAHAGEGPALAAAAPDSAWQQPGGVPLASPKAAWAAAQASMQQRRSYSAAAALAPLLSKRHERQLREQDGLGPGEPPLGGTRAEHLPPAAPAGDGGGGRAGEAAAAGAVQRDAGGRPWPHRRPQPPEQPCHSDGYFGQEEDEDEGEGMWDDLRRLAAWRSGEGTAGAAGEGSEGRGRSSPALGPPPQPGQLADAWQHAAAVPANGNLAPAGTAAPAGRLSGRGSPDSSTRSSRVIIHADVDAFYVQASRRDGSVRYRPQLLELPMLACQLTSGRMHPFACFDLAVAQAIVLMPLGITRVALRGCDAL